MSHYADMTPRPVSPPAHRIKLSMRDLRAIRTIATMMIEQDYSPKNLHRDRPEIVEELAAEIARRTHRIENDVRRELAVKHGALIHYEGATTP